MSASVPLVDETPRLDRRGKSHPRSTPSGALGGPRDGCIGMAQPVSTSFPAQTLALALTLIITLTLT